MEQFRRYIAAKPDEFLEMIKDVEEATGQAVSAACYKRPKPADDPRLEPFYAWRGQIGMIRHEDPGEDIFGPELKNRVAEFFEQLMPLYDYFNKFKN